MGGQGSTGPQGQPQQVTGGTPSGIPGGGFGDMSQFGKFYANQGGGAQSPTPQQGGSMFPGGAGMLPQAPATPSPQQPTATPAALQNYFQNFRPQAQANPTAGAAMPQQFQAPTAGQNANPFFGGYQAMGGTGGRR
jgi:hypothetical protein